MPPKTPDWSIRIKQTLKAEHGFGWNIRDHRGTVQLTRRFEDGTRSSAYLPLPWRQDSGTPVLMWVTAVRELMEQQNLTLKEAVERHKVSIDDPTKISAVAATGKKGWEAAVNAFMATKSGCRPNTLKWTSQRLKKLLKTVETAPKPRNAEAALRAYHDQHFFDADGAVVTAAGGQGRIRGLKDCIAFLNWAVDRRMLPVRFRPPTGSQLNELMRQLVGTASASVDARKDTPPFKSHQISALLDAFEAAGKHEDKLLFGLIAYLGLRPGEISILQVKDGHPTIGHIKRNHRTMHKPAKRPDPVMPLPIAGRPADEAQLMLTAFESGLVKIPKSVRTQIAKVEERNFFQDVGEAVAQRLDRFPYFRDVLKPSNRDLTTNSLRHGWAWRAHVESDNPMHERVAAAWMRHSLQTHMKHYGHWIDRESMDAALERTSAGIAVA